MTGWPGHLEVLADVVERVQLVRVEEDVAFHVGDERVVLVGVPQSADDLNRLMRPPVPGRVVEVLVEAVVLAGAGVEAGHHVPAGPAAADVVERGEPAGEVERRVVGRAGGGDEPDVLGVGGDGRQQGERLEPVQVVRRVGGVDELAVHDEQRVEQRLLGDLGRLDVVADVGAGVAGDARVLPQAVLAGAADTVDGHREMELARHGCCSLQRRPAI
jgi:hypothetical protein